MTGTPVMPSPETGKPRACRFFFAWTLPQRAWTLGVGAPMPPHRARRPPLSRMLGSLEKDRLYDPGNDPHPRRQAT